MGILSSGKSIGMFSARLQEFKRAFGPSNDVQCVSFLPVRHTISHSLGNHLAQNMTSGVQQIANDPFCLARVAHGRVD
jgi:hypothetical protein